MSELDKANADHTPAYGCCAVHDADDARFWVEWQKETRLCSRGLYIDRNRSTT
jgi:hypothetical protein